MGDDSCRSSNIISSADVRVISFVAPFDVIPTVVPEIVIASPPSPRSTCPLASRVLANVP